ncbi:MAG: hypothetical protein ACP5NV_02730 [Candidatus Woesearchaeota archaeon]
MGIFQDGLMTLNEAGILDVILPFILVFTIVFAVLQKTKILGEEKDGKPRKNFNAVIALVMGLAVVIPHVIGTYPSPESDVVLIINSALPNVSAVMIAVIMLLLIMGVFGGDVNVAGSGLAGWAVIFAIIATVVIFGNAANWFNLPNWLGFLEDSETQALIVVILVFALIIWFITKEDKEKKPGELSFMESLGKALQKPKG